MELNLPPFNIELKNKNGKRKVFCLIRKKWLVLTPEEWVRQHFLNYLFTNKMANRALTAVEYGLEYNALKKRIDILVFNNHGKPEIMIECKAPHIPLDEKVIRQIATYNSQFLVNKMCITNGLNHYWFALKDGRYHLFKE